MNIRIIEIQQQQRQSVKFDSYQKRKKVSVDVFFRFLKTS